MRGSPAANPHVRELLSGSLATLGLTAVHHVYGAFRYHTPWRHHAAAVALVVGTALVLAASAHQRRPGTKRGRLAAWILAVLSLIFVVLGFGLFEGLYNHLVKDLLFFSGASRALLLRLFPPPAYEMPNDVLFEVTGVLQVPVAAYATWAFLRFAGGMASPPQGGRIAIGTGVAARALAAISGEAVRIPDPQRTVHLQFRRFAGCPVCDLHLQSVVRRHTEIAAAGIREVVLFHSTAQALREYAAHLPFAVVADPDKRLYREFGVESGLRAMLHPRVWGPIVRAVLRSSLLLLSGKVKRVPPLFPGGGRYGLPADFLISSDGRVLACRYGNHAYDQWSVNELLALAREGGKPAPGGGTHRAGARALSGGRP